MPHLVVNDQLQGLGLPGSSTMHTCFILMLLLQGQLTIPIVGIGFIINGAVCSSVPCNSCQKLMIASSSPEGAP